MSEVPLYGANACVGVAARRAQQTDCGLWLQLSERYRLQIYVGRLITLPPQVPLEPRYPQAPAMPIFSSAMRCKYCRDTFSPG